MPSDIASLLFALTASMLTMAIALPAVMGRVNTAARQAQVGVALQAVGWSLLLISGLVVQGGWADRSLSTLSMAGIAGGLAFNARAFDLWSGRALHSAAPAIIAAVMPIGYCIGFSSYAFRVGWANGLLALQMGLVAATLWRRPQVPVGRWRWLLVVALVAQLVVTAWRGVLGAFFTEVFPAFLTPHPVNFAFAVVANVTSVLSLVGILLAHRDEAARALERLATIDGLTGILNRRGWIMRAEAEFALAVRYRHSIAVLMIDLDHFKLINDTWGHDAGDRALQLVARALQAVASPDDFIGRYGGEEFSVLMGNGDSAVAAEFDRRLRAYLAEASFREIDFDVTYSAGVAILTQADETLVRLLRAADAALYEAKARGRGQMQWADAPPAAVQGTTPAGRAGMAGRVAAS